MPDIIYVGADLLQLFDNVTGGPVFWLAVYVEYFVEVATFCDLELNV